MAYKVTIERVADSTTISQGKILTNVGAAKHTEVLPASIIMKETTAEGCPITVLKKFLSICADGKGTVATEIGSPTNPDVIVNLLSIYTQQYGA